MKEELFEHNVVLKKRALRRLLDHRADVPPKNRVTCDISHSEIGRGDCELHPEIGKRRHYS
jgi:hypothetical protein